MKLNKADKERTLNVSFPQENQCLLIERSRYIPWGSRRGKWLESRMYISYDEVMKLAAAIKQVKP